MHEFSQAEQERAQALLPIFLKVVAERRFPAEVGQALPTLGPAWLLLVAMGICSRESQFGLLLDKNGCGDGGHGHGLMQIDDRSHADFIQGQSWQDPETNIRYAIKNVLMPFFNALGEHFELFEDYGQLFRGAVAAFNCGPGPGAAGTKGVLGALAQGRDLDANTTGGDYSRDVLARAQALRAVIGEGAGQVATSPVRVVRTLPLFQEDLASKFGKPRDPAPYLIIIDLKEFAPHLFHVKDYEGNPWNCRIYGHQALDQPLKKAFRLLCGRDLAGELQTFDGCFNIRAMKSNPNMFSVHSWGLAIDLNASTNPFQADGNEDVITNFSDDFIHCFAEAGFEWGGLWHSCHDAMHFQLPWTQDWRQSDNPLRPQI